MSKVKTQKRYNKRNFLPSSSGAENCTSLDPTGQNERQTSLRMVPRRSTNNNNATALTAALFPNTAGSTNGNSITPSVSVSGALNDQIGQTLHGRLMDIKEQLNPLL